MVKSLSAVTMDVHACKLLSLKDMEKLQRLSLWRDTATGVRRKLSVGENPLNG